MQQASTLAILIATLALFSTPALSRKPAIREHYSGSWYLKHVIPHGLRVNENFNRHRDFGYVACYYARRDGSYCNVTLLRANSTNDRGKSCKALDSLTPHVDHVSQLLVPDDVKERDRVAILWSSRKNDSQKIKISYVNVTNCQRSDTDWLPVRGLSRFSKLLEYPYPGFLATFSNSTSQTSFLAFSLDDQKPTAKVISPMNYSYYNVFEEAAAVGHSYPGLFFTHMNRTETSVMFRNLTTSVPRKIGDAHDHYQKISGTNNKYGVCWRHFSQINCTQYDVWGRKVLNGTVIKLKEHFDWWKIYNLKEPAILLITGRYHKGKCAKFNLQKIQANGAASRAVEIDSLATECPHRGESTSIKLAVSEDDDNKLFCFNFVIDKDNFYNLVHLQYRRICIDQDYVNELL